MFAAPNLFITHSTYITVLTLEFGMMSTPHFYGKDSSSASLSCKLRDHSALSSPCDCMWVQLRCPHVIHAMISKEFIVAAFNMWLQKRWDRKCFNHPVLSLRWKWLYQMSSDGNMGFVWVGICLYTKNVKKYLFSITLEAEITCTSV